jgi:hypothetical protein
MYSYSPFEDKGKIFTEVIQKKPIEVMIRTINQTIRGMIHIRPKERLKDELDNTDLFLPVTNASVMDEHNNIIFQTRFMVVHRDHLVWITPVDELVSPEAEE